MKIRYRSLSDECYHIIKLDILNRKIKWGERLDVIRLAKEFGISRSPVIKAIERLAHEGLVEIIPNKGSFVVHPSSTDITEIIQVRIVLETFACELAFQNNGNLVDRLEHIAQTMVDVEESRVEIDPEKFLKYDQDIHETLITSAGNSKLTDLINMIRNQVEFFRVGSFTKEAALNAIQTHRQIIDALRQGDLEKAKLFLKKHIEQVGKDTLEALKTSEIGTTS